MRPYCALSFALCACGTAFDYSTTNAAPHRLFVHKPESVEVLSSAPPGRRYTEIGIIEVTATPQTTQGVIQDLREYAAERGCDAVITFPRGDLAVGGGSCLVYVDAR